MLFHRKRWSSFLYLNLDLRIWSVIDDKACYWSVPPLCSSSVSNFDKGGESSSQILPISFSSKGVIGGRRKQLPSQRFSLFSLRWVFLVRIFGYNRGAKEDDRKYVGPNNGTIDRTD